MAGIVFGLAGAAIGAQAGYGALGWMIGSTIGNLLFPQSLPDVHNQGPRVSDLNVQSAGYGRPLPYVRGAMRLSGTIIWAKPLREVATTTTQEMGGKGGPSQSVTQTEYRYYADFALALCEGPIAGIRRLWINGELVYNVSDDASGATIIASNERWGGLRVYLGTETQLVDDLISADVGASSAPAYLGVAYLVFEGLDVTKWGAIPKIDAEVVVDGSFGVQDLYWGGLSYTINNPPEVWLAKGRGEVWMSDVTGSKVVVMNTETHAVETITGLTSNATPQAFMDEDAGIFWVGGGTFDPIVAIDMATRTELFRWANTGTNITVLAATQDRVLVLVAARWDYGTWSAGGWVPLVQINGAGATVWPGFVANDGKFWGANSARVYGIDDAGFIQYNAPANEINSRPAYDSTRECIYYFAKHATELVKLDLATGTFTVLNNALTAVSLHYDAPSDRIIVVGAAGSVKVVKVDGTVETTYSFTPDYSPANQGLVFAYAHGVLYCVSSGNITEYRLGVISDSAPQLSTVVAAICARAGLEAADIDVTALVSDTVAGYAVTRNGTARAALEPLMIAYQFDGVESDRKIKFVKRGGAIAEVIPADELGVVMDGDEPAARLEVTSRLETELPREVRVTYVDAEADYAENVQYARRLAANSIDVQNLSLPIKLTAAQAQRVASMVLFGSWAAREGVEFRTTNRFLYLEPTDVLQLVDGTLVYTVRAEGKAESRGIVRWRGATEDVAVYDQAGGGVNAPTPTATVAGIGATMLRLLDIPLLRPQDDDVGMYVAAAGALSGWRGCELWRSNDGTTYTSTGVRVTSPTPMGVTLTELPDFTGGNIVDEHSTLRVTLTPGSGELASVTYDEFLAGEQAALIGDEIVLFRDAVLVAGSTYDLFGFLRGRAGTERFMGAHAAGDRFTLLSPSSLARVPMSLGDQGVVRHFKAVSFGQTLIQTAPTRITFQNVGKRPLAPLHLEAGRDADTKIWTIKWRRQSRLAQGWNDYVDTPVGEGSLAFELEIYSDATFTVLKRSVSGIAAETYQYGYDDQFTDFGFWPTTINVRVYQVSAEFGRGLAAEGTLT